MPGFPTMKAATAAGFMLLSLALGSSHELLFATTATLSVIRGAGLIWWVSGLAGDWQEKSNAHASRLSRASEALEHYARSAAHDLKAPARHVMLYGELLEAALARADIEAARRHVRSIRESAAEMPVIRIDPDIGGDRTLISVEDNGVGFDLEFATVASNPLARGVRTAGEGGGIGLATCRTIVQGHGGEIRVDPTFRGGARIAFTLLASAPHDEPGADPSL